MTLQLSPVLSVRPAQEEDYGPWRSLWQGYLEFYQASLSEEMTEHTWRRCLSDAEPILCLVAVREATVVGFAITILHAGTWSRQPSAYLEDLFVAPSLRGQGVGRLLIEALAERGRRQGWARLYWQTKKDNLQAQALYDQVAEKTDWRRYDLDLSLPPRPRNELGALPPSASGLSTSEL